MKACKIFELNSEHNGLSDLFGKTGEDILLSLSENLSLDPRLNTITLVVRKTSDHSSALYAFGEIPAFIEEQLTQLSKQLNRLNFKAQFIDYYKAEKLAGVLAEKMIAHYGIDQIKTFHFHAIPRGGHIVLGLLAYQLGLSSEQIGTFPKNQNTPLVLVDDCILSGLRAKEYVQKYQNYKVHFASFFSPQGINDTVESKKNSFFCISAVELEDMAPALYKESYSMWRDNWESLYGDAVLWIGQPEFIAFSWNEPESSFVNSVSNKIEAGFKILSGKQCLNNKKSSYNPKSQVYLHENGPGPINALPNVVWVEIGGDVVIAHFPSADSHGIANCFLLEGSAGEMWKSILRYGQIDPAAESLSQLFEVEKSIIFEDLKLFTQSLSESGLIKYEE